MRDNDLHVVMEVRVVGRVLVDCGYYCAPSPARSERGHSARHPPAHHVFSSALPPLGLLLSRRQPSNALRIHRGGTRHLPTARRRQTGSVRPRLLAGVQGRPRLGAPEGSPGSGRGWPTLAGGPPPWEATGQSASGCRPLAVPWPRGFPRRPGAATRWRIARGRRATKAVLICQAPGASPGARRSRGPPTPRGGTPARRRRRAHGTPGAESRGGQGSPRA